MSRHMVSATTLAVGAILSSQALAQESAAQQGGYIEEIVVTAQKRAENIQDVPISISAFSGDFIEQSNIDTLDDLATYSPNFTISNGGQETNSRISIRGVGSIGNNAIEPSVGVFIDGVYYPRPGALLGNLLDIQTVEVLRGPQGTLFGRNTPVGALNITTRDPSDEFEGQVTAGAGNYGAYEIGGVLSGPLTDSAAARLAVKYTDRDGYGDNLFENEEFGDKDNLTVRGKLRFDITDSFSVKLSADMGELNSGGATSEVFTPTSTPQFEGTLIALYGASPTTDDPYDHDINEFYEYDLDDEQWGTSIDAVWDLANGATIRSITAYREWEADVFETPIRITADILPRTTRYETETLSQELQYLSPTGETVEYVAGLFLYEEDYKIDQAVNTGGDFCIPTIFALTLQQTGSLAAAQAQAQACLATQQERFVESFFDQSLSSIAAFGQMTWNVSDQFSLTVGGRYTRDDKEGSFVQVLNSPFGALFREPESNTDMSRDDSQFTWMVNARYFTGDDTMFFATVSTGFKSGGFNSEGGESAFTLEQRVFAPEEALNYEIGVKSDLFNNAMTANVTVFRTEIDDFQDRAFDGLSFITRNAGELRQQGIEADITYAPIEQLYVLVGFSFTDSEFLEFDNGSPLPGSNQPQDLAGEEKHFSPDWQASTVAEWTDRFALWDGIDWFIRGEWQYVGEQNIGGNTNNNPQTIQDGYSLYNAGLGLESQDGIWRLGFWGRNLADEGYCVNLSDQPIGGLLGAVNPATNTSVLRCVVGEPRTYGVSFQYNF